MTQTVITSAEFKNRVGQYQDAAQSAPVTVTKYGRPHTVLLSAAMFDAITKGRVARKTADLDDATINAIAASSIPPGRAADDPKLG